MNLFGKKIIIIGLGITGFYTAKFLVSKGATVCINDIKPEDDLNPDYVNELKSLGVRIKTGGYDEKSMLKADMIVISPGVPNGLPILKNARKKGIPVIGEVELASRIIRKPIIAITGTNGKSTVTTLIGNILKDAGIKVFVGGNIGIPFISYLTQKDNADIFVLEVSSYQLDTIEEFRPFISIILNIRPDHMDRYDSFDDYVKSKLRIFKNQKKGDFLIINDDDPILSSVIPSYGVEILRYGIGKRDNRCAFLENGRIKVYLQGRELEFPTNSIGLLGIHNIINLMPTILSALILGVDKDRIDSSIRRFKGLPHRLEPVLEKNGILFLDDSKATNVDATAMAVKSLNRPIILIAGGKNKGLNYKELTKVCKSKVKYAVFIGETAPVFLKEFDGIIPCKIAKDMYDAVSMAYSHAKKGDVVLLSPACSSFDMFKDYSHRGQVFRDAIRRVVNAKEK